MKILSKFFASMILTIITLFIPAVSFASTLPEKSLTGYVTDTAHMFNQSQLNEINTVLSNTKYHYFVVTVSTLNGENIDTFGKTIAHQWNMGDQDVLYVIDLQERKFYIHTATGSPVDNVVMSRTSGSSVAEKYNNFEQQYFIPYARKGDFAGGIVNITHQMDTMQTMSSLVASVIEKILAVLVFLALVVTALVLFSRRNGAKSLINPVRKKISGLNGSVLNLDKELKEFFSLFEGTTNKIGEDISDELAQILSQSSALKKYCEQLTVPMFKLAEFKKTVESYNSQVRELERRASALRTKFEDFSKVIKQNRTAIQEKQNQLDKIQTNISSLKEIHGLELESLTKTVESHAKELDDVLQQNALDPVNAQKQIRYLDFSSTQEYIDWIVDNIQDCQSQFNQKIESARAEISKSEKAEDLVFENNPYDVLETAKLKVESLNSLFNSGDIKALKSAFEDIDNKIKSATSYVKEVLNAKAKVNSLVKNITTLFEVYSRDLNQQFEAEKTKLARDFDPSLWSIIYSDLKSIERYHEKAKELYSKIDLNDKNYKKLNTLLEGVYSTLQPAEKIRSTFVMLHSQLTSRAEEYKRSLKSSKTELNSLIGSITNHGFKDFQRSINEIDSAVETAENFASKLPLNTQELYSKITKISGLIARLSSEVNGMIKQKKDAEKKLAAKKAEFEAKKRKMGSRVSTHHHTSRYNDSFAQAQAQIDAGNFLDALVYAEAIDSIMDDMDRDYRNSSYSSPSYSSGYSSSSSDSGYGSSGSSWSDSSSSSYDSGSSSSWGSDSSSSSWDSGSSSSYDSGGSSGW